MDNASKNASDMIGSLTMKYNRGRQAAITNELVDIITGLFSIFCPFQTLTNNSHSRCKCTVGVFRGYTLRNQNAVDTILVIINR